jgi:hypothetical protein
VHCIGLSRHYRRTARMRQTLSRLHGSSGGWRFFGVDDKMNGKGRSRKTRHTSLLLDSRLNIGGLSSIVVMRSTRTLRYPVKVLLSKLLEDLTDVFAGRMRNRDIRIREDPTGRHGTRLVQFVVSASRMITIMRAMFEFKEFQITAANRSEAIYQTTSRPTTCISQAPKSKLNASHQAVKCILQSANLVKH